MSKRHRILVTGSNGFIGKNLISRLKERLDSEILTFTRDDGYEVLESYVAKADAIVHLAGVNRPSDERDFFNVNVNFSSKLCDVITNEGRNIPLIFASSTQAEFDNHYGRSKLAAEKLFENFAIKTGAPIFIYRLPGVFGKWCRPNYNSVVATFCNNIANDLPISIDNPNKILKLVYVDDVVDEFLKVLNGINGNSHTSEIPQTYQISLGELADQLLKFKNCRTDLTLEQVGMGFIRALYSTYISYLPTNKFLYDLPQHIDQRGIFVEILKTKDSGQFSYFTIQPGVTRGSHYHHTKTEKFIIVKGTVMMRFRNLITNDLYEIRLFGDKPQVVDSVPGWVHDITNIGESSAIVILWANEVFNQIYPDTFPCEV
jgi:UDP-2-acetamido-2,6-beta-L-arabino-hexul-4-ose reductase